MGVTNTEYYSDRQNALAVLLKAIAHPARVAIIEFLMKADSCICGDIVNDLPLSQSTVSQHLRELKNAGLIKGTVEGTAICYCVNEKAITGLRNYFAALSGKLDKKKKKCF